MNSTNVNKILTHDYKMVIIYLLIYEPTNQSNQLVTSNIAKTFSHILK
jgi:hypothetical protein